MTDRPVAITGLQRRMIHDLRAQGGFGIFDDRRSLLQHSLLWQRGKEFKTLTRTDFKGERSIPSWSWMAYNEGIDFLDIPLGDVRWLPGEIISPWGGTTSPGEKNVSCMEVRIRNFELDAVTEDGDEYSIFYDSPELAEREKMTLKCVLMGQVKKRGSRSRKELVHCVLFVSPSSPANVGGEHVYQRIGVGFLTGKFIDLKTGGAMVSLR